LKLTPSGDVAQAVRNLRRSGSLNRFLIQTRSDVMSILGKIISGMFKGKGKPDAAEQAPPVVTPTAAPSPAPAAPAPAPAPAAASVQNVDVAGILDFMNDQRDQKLNWRTSIVDLMKLLGFESSLAERKALADELGYTGDKSDTASMNIWLHKQVIQKIRDNGGQIPNDL
jgi:hypothetical protein